MHLANLSVFGARTLLIQAGAFGEHQFISATYEHRISDYPGVQGPGGYAAPPLQTETHTIPIDNSLLRVRSSATDQRNHAHAHGVTLCQPAIVPSPVGSVVTMPDLHSRTRIGKSALEVPLLAFGTAPLATAPA